MNNDDYNTTNNNHWIFYLLSGALIVFLIYLFSGDFFPNASKSIPSTPEVSEPPIEQEATPANPEESAEPSLPVEESGEEEEVPQSPKKSQPIAGQETKTTQADYIALADEFTNNVAFDEMTRIRGTSDSISIVLNNLNDDNFEFSIAYLQSVSEKDVNYVNAQYYAGLALYQKGKAKNAIPYLRKASEDPFYLYVNHAEWYLLLAQLKAGELAASKQLLNDIIKRGKEDPVDPPMYYEDAVKLKARLDEL